MAGNNYIGQVLDQKYKISRLLGESGMGVVYVGEDMSNNAKVAIKILPSATGAPAESIKRFFREARAAVELRHPNIIKIFDVGLSDQGDPYMVQEYLEGESLADLLLRVGKVKPIPAMGIIEPVLRAVGTMHQRGILHRGIKPENIYLVHQSGLNPTVKLIDFGLTKFTSGKEEPSKLTMVGVTLGDYAYISPEQIRDSSAVDRRSDLYTIATIMYELLTGDVPYSDIPHDQRLAAKMTKPPTPPVEYVSAVPQALNALVLRTMSIKPEGRPASADEMLKVIEKLSGYGARESKLVKCAQGAKRITIAGGAYDPQAMKAAEERAKNRPLKRKRSGAGKAWDWLTDTLLGRIVFAGSILAVIAVILIAALHEGDKPATDRNIVTIPPPPPPPPELKPKDVQIELRGLPDNAKIYYDDAPIPLNPFRVALKEAIVTLRIEAEGYENYVTSVVPAEDQVVKVEMKQKAISPDTEEAAPPIIIQTPSVPRNDKPPGTKTKIITKKPPDEGDDDDFTKINKGIKVNKGFD